MIHVGSVEAVWLALTLIGAAVTLWALVDAVQDRHAVRQLNGDVRGIIARGNVRRESVRFLIQGIFLGLAVPQMFVDREIELTPFLAGLMALPALMLLNTGSDYYDRRRVHRKLEAAYAAGRMRDAS